MFAIWQHAHLIGKAIKTRHMRGDVELKPIAVDNHYDFDYQETRLFKGEIPLRKVCTYCVFVLCTLCWQFFWIVLFWLPLRYSLTFIYCQAIIQTMYQAQVINLRGLLRTQFKLIILFSVTTIFYTPCFGEWIYNWVVIVIYSVKREIYMI
jgi:hypothetical protein